MDPLEWILAFVDQISAPAKAMTGNIRELTKSIKELQEATGKVNLSAALRGGGGGSGGGRSSGSGQDPAVAYLKQQIQLNKERTRQAKEYERFWQKSLAAQEKGSKLSSGFANMWSKIGLKMQKDQAAALKAAEPGVSKAFGDMWQRIGMKMMADQTKAMKKAATEARKASEQAAHKPWFGGHKSFGDLLGARAKNKASGIATGAADAILGLPGTMITGAAGAISTIVEGTATMAFNFGKAAISAQALREDTVAGFTAMFGSADVANKLFDRARVIAKTTKFDTADVVQDFGKLAAGGFKINELEKIYLSAADVGSGRNSAAQQRYMLALGKLKSSPEATYATFAQGARASAGQINANQALADMLGIKDQSKLRDMFKDRKISGETAVNALVEASRKYFNAGTGGKIGGLAQSLGDKTWSGAISNIKAGLGDVLNMQLPDNHPINKFKSLLQAIGSSGGLFDETSANGRRFSALMSRLVEDVFSIFGGLAGKEQDTISSLLTLAESMEKLFRRATDYIRDKMVPAIMEAINSPNLDDHLVAFAAKITAIVGKGVWQGIKSGLVGDFSDAGLAQQRKFLQENNKAMFANASWGFKSPFSDESPTPAPSASATTSGPIMSTGAPIRSYASGGVVPGPYGKPQLAIVHGGEAFMGLGGVMSTGDMMGGRGGGMSMSVTVQIMGSANMDEASLKDVVSQGAYDGFMRCMEQAAAQQGAQR